MSSHNDENNIEDGIFLDEDGVGDIEMHNTNQRRKKGSRRYESVSTNYITQAPTRGFCWVGGCFVSVLCQIVVIVAAMIMVGTAGYLLGSAQPDLLIATINATTGIDLATLGNNISGTSVVSDVGEVDLKSFETDEMATGCNETGLDDDVQDVLEDTTTSQKTFKVRYDPSSVLAKNFFGEDGDEWSNPFNSPPKNGNSVFLTPPHPFSSNPDDAAEETPAALGFLRSPHLAGDRLVFLSEGDAYVTTVADGGGGGGGDESIPASKVTTTVGNVIDPKWHPTLPLLAYTATYSGRRDVYLMDLSASSMRRPKSPVRLTYWDVGGGGVSGVVGWIKTDDTAPHANALVIRALSNDAALPDYRLYVIHLGNSYNPTASGDTGIAATDASSAVLEVEPVPLAQAMDAARFENCWYFVRVKQSSHTIRYVGGTAENLWKYCDASGSNEEEQALLSASSSPLFDGDDYRGTSKSPQLYHSTDSKRGMHYLFFLSDRGHNPDASGATWIPDRMNVWALPLYKKKQKRLENAYSTNDLIRITDTACDFEGRTIQEFSVDETTGNLVARIGADLYLMPRENVEAKIDAASAKKHRALQEEDDEEAKQQKAIENELNEQEDEQEDEQEQSPLTEEDEEDVGEDVDYDHDEGFQQTGEEMESDSGEDDFFTEDRDYDVNSTSTPTSVTTIEFDNDDGVSNPVASETLAENLPSNSGSVDAATETPSPSPPTKPSKGETGESKANEIGDADVISEDQDSNSTKPPAKKYYYNFESPELVTRSAESGGTDHYSGTSTELKRLPIVVYSDFFNDQERLVPVEIASHFRFGDVYETLTGSTQMLLTLRGQAWVAPVGHDDVPKYVEAGANLPARRYRVAPGAMMGGSTRILAALHVPNPPEDDKSDRRLAVILATDPLTPTAEHAFYLVETQPGATPLFVDMDQLPKPFLGGIVSGGSTRDGGLGSVKTDTLAMSPCGNRMAWSDTDGRIVVMNLPQYQEVDASPDRKVEFVVLPKQNELGEPMVGNEVGLSFSPGGRYLAINHHAKNRFEIISIADLGDPLGDENKIADISLGRIVQATPSKFNSVSPYWGKTPTDIHDFAQNKTMAKLFGVDEPDDVATALYFLSDRDLKTDVTSPWGYRQRMPHFVDSYAVYALPLSAKGVEDPPKGEFRGGGAEELQVESLLKRMDLLKALLEKKTEASTEARERRQLAKSIHPLAGAFGYAERSFRAEHRRRELAGDNDNEKPLNATADGDDHLEEAEFEKDMDIDFGPMDLTFARTAYRLSSIPAGDYDMIVCQNPSGDILLVENSNLLIFQADEFPSDKYEKKTFTATSRKLGIVRMSTNRKFIILVYAPDGAIRVVPNTAAGTMALQSDLVLDESVVDADGMHLSIWPTLEYRQLYDDAWRMLRDYFYDPDMTSIDWPGIHERYLPLVERCSKREELDDVLVQMSSELSALHVFVYGGEYNSPTHGDKDLEYVNQVGSLGAILKRTPAWKGYTVMNIPEADPDFTKIDQSTTIYSPLHEQSLRLSGQRGLQVGDVIVGVNGESVMSVPDIHMLLRGTAGRSVRLDVLRLASRDTDGSSETATVTTESSKEEVEASVEAIITVPLSPDDNANLLYRAWEWKTEQLAEKLAEDAGISVGYVHLKDMSGASAEDAFARGFFPNYHKQGFILDVRHNRGGNIDSWVLDVLQRKAWMYWQSRDFTPETGGLGWDEHYAFRGHLVVLVDEKTSSDGEGVSRGISELGLGKIIGTRTWGGGIWLASDNHLVDGGIATAPEIGDYNDNFSWGMGIENMGLEPDIVVDNDPHETYTGKDRQLERAIEELKRWIEDEPIPSPNPKTKRKDVTMGDRECKPVGFNLK
eukprot:CAMPEP_0172362114 /NCGR_PEP_ID=MMETSP1060-20121228/5799_1 /TAXON_ID=37318 /ORGANISM="Pseudo-nitzschia pungens, Strain cf. cingulata" /LENGTH=1849 /DNA_ID=CAMNT_0013084539 /DNA_START=224 /DNA_END=5773 /DNA_ORIENTATION=-